MSIAETVEEKKITPKIYQDSLRQANWLSIFTYWFSNTLIESVRLNKGKMVDEMVEDMNKDPKRDEMLLSHF